MYDETNDDISDQYPTQDTGFSMTNGLIRTYSHLFTEIDLKRITLTLKHIRTSWI